MAPEYVIAADLGQVNDPTAIAVLERREQLTGRQEVVQNVAAFFDGFKHQPRLYNAPQVAGFYQVVHLERLPLGTAYTAIPDRLQAIDAGIRQRWIRLVVEQELADTGRARSSPLDAPVDLVVDQTGVGRPVVDLLREAGVDPVAITITSGDTVTRVAEREYRVPKRDLVGAVQSAMQTRRLQAAASLPDWPVLKGELANFKAKISLTGHDSYGAGDDWREGNHDDLVLSVAMGVWWGENGARPPSLDPAIVAAWTDLPR
jgi:hypothetical protein